MAPASLLARGASSAWMSSSEASPPEAITGIDTASASAMVASRLSPCEHAVAGNIRIDNRRDAGVLKALGDIERFKLRAFRPALHRDLAVARIEPDRDAPRKRLGGRLHQSRIAHRRRADDDAGDALVEPARDGRVIANAAAELDRNAHRRKDALDRAAFIGWPAKAPSRSTICRYSKPCAAKSRACSAGSR